MTVKPDQNKLWEQREHDLGNEYTEFHQGEKFIRISK
jgi:hypothetical protein